MIVNPPKTSSIHRVFKVEGPRVVTGFTLVEVALVLLIVSILLGYTLAIYPAQQEVKQYSTANEEMESIINYLIRFAQINGRLPCPDSTVVAGDFNGEENVDAGWDCDADFAFLPGRTLGIQGSYDEKGRLLDPWSKPYLYAVSDGAGASDDFIDRVNIKTQGLGGMVGDIHICNDSAALGNHMICPVVTSIVMSRVAAIVISTGKDGGNSTSNIQAENQDNFNVAATLDRIFVYAQRSDKSGAEYDDLVKWLPTNLFLSKLIEADQLP